MGERVRVTVEADGQREFTRVHDTEGVIEGGGASFRFRVGGVDESDDGTNEGSVGREPENRPVTPADPRIAAIEEIPTDGTIRCEANGERRSAEVIRRRDGGEVFAWQNSCPHEPDVRLDTGGGAIISEG